MLKPWFLQPKSRIIVSDRPPDDSGFGRDQLPDDLLASLPWVSDFDPFNPADQARLRLIIRVSNVKGQGFVVHSARVSSADGTLSKALATFASFPTHDEVSAAVAEPHGGGPYNVWATLPRPQLLRTFFVQGSAPKRSAESRQQNHIADLTAEIKADLMEMAIEHLREHPEVFNELALALLCKELDVPVPEMPDFEEEIVREAMRDPEYREKEAARVMESRKAEAERIAESREMDDLFAYLKKVNSIARMMGYERGKKPSAGAGLDEVMKTLVADGGLRDILEAFKNVRHPRNHSQGQQASTGAEPPFAEELPGAETGTQESQVTEHLPSNGPPRLAAPQEPRVMEKPVGGTGPQRVDIGVPADSLGLLGLRGDTSFVDWPLV